jgi:hypothetical protein
MLTTEHDLHRLPAPGVRQLLMTLKIVPFAF